MKSNAIQDTIWTNKLPRFKRLDALIDEGITFFSEELATQDDVWAVLDPENPYYSDGEHTSVKVVCLKDMTMHTVSCDWLVYPINQVRVTVE